MRKPQYSAIVVACLMAIAAGCKKPTPVQPPPPPPPKQETPAPKPPPARSTISSFTAEPTTIQRGQAATLRWATADATEIAISPGIGAVAASGSRQVFPSSTTTYELATKGPGGDDRRTVTVNVTAPPPPPPPPPKASAPKRSVLEALASEVGDVFFDYDKFDVREDARSALTRNADSLKRILSEFSGSVITIEGHCDERGSAEYNLGLGDRRATAVKEFLTQLGVSADRLRVISYGKERPQCTESDESCWQRNRRAHFATQ